MENEFQESFDDLDLSVSSSAISYPLGKKILNISTVTEISDEEMENQKYKEVNVDSLSLGLNNGILNKIEDCDVFSSKDEDRSNILTEYRTSDLPPQVSHTLRANANFIIDKKFLNDLLDEQNTNNANNLLDIQKNYNSGKSSFDDMSKYLKLPEKNVLNNSSDSGNLPTIKAIKNQNEPGETVSEPPYLSISSTPKKVIPTRSELPSERTKDQRHVNFAQENMNRESQSLKSENDRPMMMPTRDSLRYNMHSFTNYGPEIVFNKLSEIRNHLDLKETGEEADVSDLPLSRLLVAKLNNQKQRTKDLEEELTLNEASLAKTTCELEVVQKRLARREEQLKEAGDQIGKLQNEWQCIQQRLTISRDSYRNQNDQLKKIVENLKTKNESAEKQVKEMKEQCKEFTHLKAHTEGMKHQVEKSSEQSQEIFEENQRLNAALKQTEEKLNHYEKENKNIKTDNETLHSKLDNLIIGRNDIEDELKLLKKRHSALLQKATEDAELKEKVIQEKEATLETVEKLKAEKSTLMEDLHYQYQNQLQNILLKKMSEIGTHFVTKEKQSQEELNSELDRLKLAFESERKALILRNADELGDLKARCEKELAKKAEDLEEVRKDNLLLRSQIEAIVSAISSAIPRDKRPLSHRQENHTYADGVVRKANYNARSGGNSAKEYNLTRLEGLETCEMSKNDAPKLDKGNGDGPRRSGSCETSPQLPVPPLITSTSLSTISDGSDYHSHGRLTARESKNAHHKAKGKLPNSTKSKKRLPRVRMFNGRKLITASQLLGSDESLISSDKSSNAFLREVDKEMSDLVQEINSMSEIVAPYHTGDSSKVDASLEQDSAQLTLQKIDRVSDLLSKYVHTKT